MGGAGLVVVGRPDRPVELLQDGDRARASRVLRAMLQMTKIDIAKLERADEQE